MKQQFEALSSHLYETHFKSIFKEKDWKIAYTKKEMDGRQLEIVTIGARFDDLFWDYQDKLRKNHFYIELKKDKGEKTEIFSVDFHEKNAQVQESTLVQEIRDFFKEQNIDTLIQMHGYGYDEKKLIATGKKSKHVLSLINEIKKGKWIKEYDVKNDTFTYHFTSTTLQFFEDTENKRLHIYAKDHKITEFQTAEEVREWVLRQDEEQKRIEKMWEKMMDVIKKRVKTTQVEQYYYRSIAVDRKVRNDVSIVKQYLLGKEKYKLEFGDQKANVKTLEEAEEKAIEMATKFSNNYRLRKITGHH